MMHRLPAPLRRLAVPVLLLAPASSSLAAPKPEPAIRLYFDLPSEPAERALSAFCGQAGIQLIFSPAEVSGVTTNPVRGEMTAGEALGRMLAGTALAAVTDPMTGLFAVRRSSASAGPAPQAPPPSAPAPPPPESPSPRATALVTLSPFEVQSSSRDIGYYTQNTTAGTRLNTSLGDLGASITVISRRQMEDTSSVNLNDLFLYEASTEGTENFTADTGFQKGAGVNDVIQSSPQTSNRVRGLASVDLTRDYFISNPNIQLDTYNLDDVELSRGPNSTLFGVGSPAGILNQSLEKAALGVDRSEAAVRFGSFGDFRSSLNLNRSLIPDRLAIAVAALYANAHPTGEEPEYDIQRREFAALTFRPLERTTLRANIEFYDNPNRRADSITPADEITPWLANGSPKWDPVTYTATVGGVTSAPITNNTLLPAGLAVGLGNFNDTSAQMYLVHGQLQLWEEAELGTNFIVPGTPTNAAGSLNGTGANAAVNAWGPIGFERLAGTEGNYSKFAAAAPAGQVTYPLFHDPGISDPKLLNWQGVNLLAPDLGEDKAVISDVELEQQVIDRLFLEAGWYRERFNRVSHNYLGGNVGNAVQVDPNIRLLNGAPNPFFGEPYIPMEAGNDATQSTLNEQERLSLAYDLDFTANDNWTRWLGRHEIQPFYQHRDAVTQNAFYLMEILDAHSWSTTTDIGGAQLGTTGLDAERYYLSGGGAAISFDPGQFVNSTFTYPLTWYNTALNGGSWTNEPVRTGPVPFINQENKQEQQDWSYAGSLQDYFFGDRLVLTLGQRHDYVRNRVTTGYEGVDPATGMTDLNSLGQWGSWSGASGITRQLGGVLHLFPWLSVHYNQSGNFQVAPLGEDAFGNVLPNPSGHGKDYGISTSLFGEKLVAEMNWYKSDVANSRESNLTYYIRALRTDYGGFLPWAQEIATNDLGPSAGAAAINSFAQTIVQYPGGLQALSEATSYGADTETISARGWEFNLIYNPLRNWTMKFTADRDVAVDSSVYPNIQRYLAARLPIWTAATDPLLGPFWTTVSADRGGGGVYSIAGFGSPQQWLDGTVDAAGLDVELAQQGHDQPDLSEYHFNYLTNYQFVSGRLAGFGIGTALRYETPAAIGYLGGSPDPAALGAIDTLQASDPVLGKEVLHQDAWISYRMKMPFAPRVRMTVQLNCRDLWSEGYLLVVGANPDGSPQEYRIVPPRQWYLQTTFDF